MTKPKIPVGLVMIHRRSPAQTKILVSLRDSPKTLEELKAEALEQETAKSCGMNHSSAELRENVTPLKATAIKSNLKKTLQILISKGKIVPTPEGKYEIRSKN